MAKKIKRQPPSRIRYEKNHPIVSCRVSRDIFDRLVEAKEVEDKSFADILKIGLGKQEAQVEKIVEAKKKAMEEGYKKGYAAAELRYKVTYNICLHNLNWSRRSNDSPESFTCRVFLEFPVFLFKYCLRLFFCIIWSYGFRQF